MTKTYNISVDGTDNIVTVDETEEGKYTVVLNGMEYECEAIEVVNGEPNSGDDSGESGENTEPVDESDDENTNT